MERVEEKNNTELRMSNRGGELGAIREENGETDRVPAAGTITERRGHTEQKDEFEDKLTALEAEFDHIEKNEF